MLQLALVIGMSVAIVWIIKILLEDKEFFESEKNFKKETIRVNTI